MKCGRGEHCLAAQEIELEVDCEADESTAGILDHNHGDGQTHGPTASHDPSHDFIHIERLDNRDDEEPGYFRQEIVGIGGVVKHKVKKRIALGACVVEHEEERETGRYLRREETGQHRSWCAWCSRVVPSMKDLQNQGGLQLHCDG